MAQDQSKNKEPGKRSHDTGSLFTEWPTPADTVKGFGGNPNQAEHSQWKKKDAPGVKSR
jgi:hypothetical protein